MNKLTQKYLNEKRLVVTFNKRMIDNYTEQYFKKFPKRKKQPLEFLGKSRLGQLPSWNRIINCPNRIVQNQWKQELSDYTHYIIEEMNIANLNLDKCIVVVKQFQPTRAKSDSDNIYLKSSLDALVKNGVLIEDNYTVLNPCILSTFYDKSNPRTEIIIYPVCDVFTHDVVLDMVFEDLKEELKKSK